MGSQARIALAALCSVAMLGFLARQRVLTLATLLSTYTLFPLFPVPTLDPLSLPSPNASSSESRILVPRVIHQVLLGGPDYVMRPTWREARASCMELHPEWEFKLWQDESADEFVLTEWGPDIFAMYRGYKQEIMRSNVLRYLLLSSYGGVYLDLDLKCRANLDGFLAEAFVTPPAQPTGVNNAFIVAQPHHPFFDHLVDHLPYFNLGWLGSPYISNMLSTGCQFFSTMHLTYKWRQRDMKVLPWEYRLNGHVVNPLFEHLGASSWHKKDAAFILWLGRSIEVLKRGTDLSLALCAVTAAIALGVYASRLRRARKRPSLQQMVAIVSPRGSWEELRKEQEMLTPLGRRASWEEECFGREEV